MTHTITLTDEQRHEVAKSIVTKIQRIQAKLRWQDRLLQRGGGYIPTALPATWRRSAASMRNARPASSACRNS